MISLFQKQVGITQNLGKETACIFVVLLPNCLFPSQPEEVMPSCSSIVSKACFSQSFPMIQQTNSSWKSGDIHKTTRAVPGIHQSSINVNCCYHHTLSIPQPPHSIPALPTAPSQTSHSLCTRLRKST